MSNSVDHPKGYTYFDLAWAYNEAILALGRREPGVYISEAQLAGKKAAIAQITKLRDQALKKWDKEEEAKK